VINTGLRNQRVLNFCEDHVFWHRKLGYDMMYRNTKKRIWRHSALGTRAFAVSCIIDTKRAHASINFKVSQLSYSYVMGRFDKFTNGFEFDLANPAVGSV